MCKLNMKHHIEDLGMKRENHHVKDKICLEKEKTEINLSKMDAKFYTRETCNKAKPSCNFQETQEKAKESAKRGKAS